MEAVAYIQNVAVMTVLAGIVAIVFARFRWPKMLGYIGVGLLMNKYTWGGSFLVNEDSVQIFGQMGVIYLMLMMGLGFSTSQVRKMKSVAMPVAFIDTVVMTWLGYTVGTKIFDWGMVPSLFLGVAICDSATTMLAKVIDEMKWDSKPFVRYALGTSVCEDIVCVALIAVITGVANGRGISIVAAGASLGALFVFFLAVFIFGLILIPRLLVSVGKTHDDEALLLTFVGCCCFISWMALKLNFSLALGAFLVGIIGATSDVHKRLRELLSPLVMTNSAVFFVSVGLLVDPMACLVCWREIVVLFFVVVIGKLVNCTVGALMTGQSIRTAVQMGMSLAQIGEFAFMVSVLYVTLTGDDKCPIFAVVIAVSVLTTLLNPMMIRLSVPVGDWLEKHIPFETRRQFETYRGFVAKLQTADKSAMFHRVIRNGFIQLGVVGILNFAVEIACKFLVERDWSDFSVFFDDNKRLIFCLLADAFMVAMLIPAIRIGYSLGRAFSTVIVGREGLKWRQSMRSIITLTVRSGVIILWFIEVLMLTVNILPEETWQRCVICGFFVLAALFGKEVLVKAVDRATTRFHEALGAEERRAKMVQMMTFAIPEDHVSRLEIDLCSPAIGATVFSLDVRAKTGATIVSIERGTTEIRNIGPDTEIQVGDVLVAVGGGSQIAALKDLLGIVS